MVKLIVAGAAGRMGTRIIALAQEDPEFQVLYGLDVESKVLPGNVPSGPDLSQVQKADVLIDFSVPEATLKLAETAAKQKKPMVIGTTGFSPEQDKVLAGLAKTIALVKAPNMSLGVNVFFRLAQDTARSLKGYAVEIIEAHHVHKKDAPSGTALYAGGLIEKVTGKAVKYQSVREGEIIGDHRVIFTGPTDRLELFHHAASRDMFATGALQAAKWVVEQTPGLYSMQDVLGL